MSKQVRAPPTIPTMSRLFDRILANGCRPATEADFLDLVAVDERAPEPDWEITADNYNRYWAELHLDVPREPFTAESAKVAAYSHRRTARKNISDERFDLESLAHAVVIAGDDVGAYVYNLPPGDLGEHTGIVAPPFESFWIECRSPNRFGLHSWGVLFDGREVPAEKAQHAERWRLRAHMVFETEKGDPWGPVADYIIRVDQSGHLWPSDDDGRGAMFGRPNAVVAMDEDDDFFDVWGDALPEFIFSALLTVSFMHCKNVDMIDNDPPPALSKSFARKHGRPLTSFKTLNIDPMRRVLDREGNAATVGLTKAIHICRGHFKSFSPSAPLFGKLVGAYWWADHVRGDRTAGVVDKDYRLRIESDGFGRRYQPADETPPSSRSQRDGSNPDLSGRGWVAHNRTQNLLAAAIERAGHSPLSPRPEDPQFDIGWMTHAEIWVCEVKSLTTANEMRQMHTAIGQVIDYAHRLDSGGRAARKLIAVESKPMADHWIDELAAQRIVLVWPERFDSLFTKDRHESMD